MQSNSKFKSLPIGDDDQKVEVLLPTTRKRKDRLVLVAEENRNVRSVISKLLDLYRIRILEAESSEETVDVAVLHRPDLIIIDCALSRTGGFETARLIRSICSLSIVPIIFLSDYPDRVQRSKAFAVGNDYLVKPLHLDKLDTILEKFLFLKGN